MGGCAGKPKDLDSSSSSKASIPKPSPAPNIANKAKSQSHDQTKADRKNAAGSAVDSSTELPFVDAPETPISPQADENKPLPLPPGKTYAAEAKVDSVEKPKANAKEMTTKDDKKQAF